MLEVKSISLDDALKSKSGSLYVLNRAVPAGNINFEVVAASGSRQMVRLPITWVPFDLTTQAAKSAILDSADFRRLVQSRRIVIAESSSAEAALQDPEAAAESNRLYSITEDNSSSNETIRLSPTSGNQMRDGEMKRALAEASTGELGGASPFAYNLVHTKDLSDDKVIAMLRGNAHTMSEEDLRYVVESSQQPRVKEVAAELLASFVS